MFKKTAAVEQKRPVARKVPKTVRKTVVEVRKKRPLKEKQGCWFAAATSLGDVYITVHTEGKSASPDAIQYALLLEKYETVIQLFENWIGVALNFRPVNKVSEKQRVQMVFIERENPSIHGKLLLPVSALPDIEKRVESLSEKLKVQWKPLPALLKLSSVEISLTQLKKTEVGGMYLLSESFRPEWFAKLEILAKTQLEYKIKIVDNRIQIVQQNKNWDNAILQSKYDIKSAKLNKVSVILDETVNIPANYFMTWTDNNGYELGEKLINPSVTLLLGQKKIADGKLFPVSHGYAVMIENCY